MADETLQLSECGGDFVADAIQYYNLQVFSRGILDEATHSFVHAGAKHVHQSEVVFSWTDYDGFT